MSASDCLTLASVLLMVLAYVIGNRIGVNQGYKRGYFAAEQDVIRRVGRSKTNLWFQRN